MTEVSSILSIPFQVIVVGKMFCNIGHCHTHLLPQLVTQNKFMRQSETIGHGRLTTCNSNYLKVHLKLLLPSTATGDRDVLSKAMERSQ